MSEQENTEITEAPKPKLSKVLRGISQLLLTGLYSGAHSQILFESVGVLEVLANAEEKKELEAEAAKEPKLEVVPDPCEGDEGTGLFGRIISDDEPEGECNVQDGI